MPRRQRLGTRQLRLGASDAGGGSDSETQVFRPAAPALRLGASGAEGPSASDEAQRLDCGDG